MKKPTRFLGSIIPLFGLLLLAGCSAPKKPEAIELVYPSPPDPPRFYFERTLFGTGSVRQESDRDRLRTVLTGERSRAGAPFQKPFDVAVHQGRVFVTDTVDRIVHVLDFPEQKAFQIGDRGDKGYWSQMVEQLASTFIRRGEPFSVSAVENLSTALTNCNQFQSIHLDTEETPSGLLFTITVTPYKRIKDIRIRGKYPLFEECCPQ